MKKKPKKNLVYFEKRFIFEKTVYLKKPNFIQKLPALERRRTLLRKKNQIVVTGEDPIYFYRIRIPFSLKNGSRIKKNIKGEDKKGEHYGETGK